MATTKQRIAALYQIGIKITVNALFFAKGDVEV
jgi:hypothetical protein